MGCLPAGDLGFLREEVAELVGAGEQHPLGERVDLERQVVVARQVDDLRLEVDRQLGVRSLAHQLEQLRVAARARRRSAAGRSSAQLLRKMSANDGRDDGPDAPRRERPWRVLARRPRAEVVAGQEDAAGRPCPGSVEHEARVLERSRPR